jgi:hypothetical protein
MSDLPLHSTLRAKLRLPPLHGTAQGVGARCFEVTWSEERAGAQGAAPLAPAVSHHIVVVDRSSSMAEVIGDLKHTLKKLLVLDEFRDARLRVSLISYSSLGDLSVHFERLEVREVMRAGSEAAASLDGLKAWGRTSPSQAVEAALALIQEDEVTAISLHSDGFADDPSYTEERARLEALVLSLSARPVTFNTVAHAPSCDVALLSSLAHLGSGVCVVAEDLQAIYAALRSTSALVSRPTLSPFTVTGEGVWALRSSADSKFVCGEGARVVRGVSAEGARALVRLVEVSEEGFDALPVEEVSPVSARGREALLSYARACLALGRLSLAKQALYATRDEALLRDHRRALTPAALVAFARGLEGALLSGDLGARPTCPPPPRSPSLLEVLEALHAHAHQVRLLPQSLGAHYQRRSLRMTAGVRGEGGALHAPEYSERAREGEVRFHGVELSRMNASLSLLTSAPIALVNAQGVPLEVVEGVTLEGLRRFRSYSVVSDGQLNLPALTLRVEGPELLSALRALGVLEGGAEPADHTYTLNLAALPLAPEPREWLSPGLFERLARARALVSALDALTAGRSARYSEAQLKALRAVGVSDRLFVNLPQTPDYDDLDAARLDGRVDSMSRYVVHLGDDEVTSLTRLPSANAFFRAQYVVTRAGALLEAPQLSDLHEGVTLSHRHTTKDTPTRRLLRPLFDELLGLSREGQGQGQGQGQRLLLRETLADLCVPAPLAERLCGEVARGVWEMETLEQVMERASRGLDALYTHHLSPLVFYVGCTGALPHDLEARALTPQELLERCPHLKLTRAEEEATFFMLADGQLLSVYTEEVLFSRD